MSNKHSRLTVWCDEFNINKNKLSIEEILGIVLLGNILDSVRILQNRKPPVPPAMVNKIMEELTADSRLYLPMQDAVKHKAEENQEPVIS